MQIRLNLNPVNCNHYTKANLRDNCTQKLQSIPNSSDLALDALTFKGRYYLPAIESKTCQKLIKNEAERFTNYETRLLNNALRTFKTEGNPAYFLRQALKCHNAEDKYLDADGISEFLNYVSNEPLKTQKVLGNLLNWKDEILFSRTGLDVIYDIMESRQADMFLDSMVVIDARLKKEKFNEQQRAQIIGNTMSFVSGLKKVPFSLINKVSKIYSNPTKQSQDSFDFLPVMIMSTKEIEKVVDQILAKK